MNLTQFFHIYPTDAHGHARCSKMPGGEGIAVFLLLCYVAAALLIFASINRRYASKGVTG